MKLIKASQLIKMGQPGLVSASNGINVCFNKNLGATYNDQLFVMLGIFFLEGGGVVHWTLD